MTAAESIRSAARGLSRLPKSSDPATEADRYYLLFAHVGAAGEAIKVIKQALADGQIRREWIEADQGQANLWDQITAEPASLKVKVAMRARDKYWAHWDPDVAERFVSKLEGDAADLPIAESSGGGENASTSFRWVRESWFIDLEQVFGLKTGDEAVQLIQDIVELAPAVGELASILAMALIRHAGLDLKQTGSSA